METLMIIHLTYFNVSILYPLKRAENLQYLGDIEWGTLVRKGLMQQDDHIHSHNIFSFNLLRTY